MSVLSVYVSLSACFFSVDMHACVFIHNAAAAAAAFGCVFIYIREGFGVFLKLLCGDEIHQGGAGKTTRA